MHDQRTTTETHLRTKTKGIASTTHESLLPVWRCKGTLFKLDSAGAMTLSCSRRVTVLEVAATFFNEWSFFVIMAFELWLLRQRPGEEAVGRLCRVHSTLRMAYAQLARLVEETGKYLAYLKGHSHGLLVTLVHEARKPPTPRFLTLNSPGISNLQVVTTLVNLDR